MVFMKPLLLLINAVSSSSILVERTPATIRGNLTLLDTYVRKLNTTTSTWDGTFDKFTLIHDAFWQVVQQQGYLNATIYREAATYTCADSNFINAYITSPLEPDILQATRALIAKRALFYKIDLYRYVSLELDDWRKAAQGFFKGYNTRVCAASRTQEQQLASKIDTDLLNAFKQFNTTK